MLEMIYLLKATNTLSPPRDVRGAELDTDVGHVKRVDCTEVKRKMVMEEHNMWSRRSIAPYPGASINDAGNKMSTFC